MVKIRTTVTLELDAVSLAAVQSALTVAALQAQQTLALINAQLNAQLSDPPQPVE